MNLQNFEKQINNVIVARGYDYYVNNCVISVKEVEKNFYVVTVEGSNLYKVEVELDDQEAITASQCDCPYDRGEYCKHQVSAFFAIRDAKNNEVTNNLNTVYPAYSQIEEPDMKELLLQRTKSELIEFILAIASDNEEIEQLLKLHFNEGTAEDEISQSENLIRTYIRNNSSSRGYIAYNDVWAAIKGTGLVLDRARIALAKNDFIQALHLSLCVIREMMSLLENADDSSGYIGGEIEESLALIHEIVASKFLSQPEKASIFHLLLEEASHTRYEGWTDWKLEFLECCSKLADTLVLRNVLEKHFEALKNNHNEDSWSNSYLTERINLIRYKIIEHFDGRKKALDFIEQNLQYPEFRKMAIENAMAAKDYNAVVNLTLDGEKEDQEFRGQVNQWKKYRYQAFQRSGRLEDMRGLAMEFILDDNFEYYKELKNTYNSQEWSSIYPEIFLLLENKRNSIYPLVLIEEGEKQKLLTHIKSRPSMIVVFYDQLLPEFSEVVYTLFAQYIELSAVGARNRKDYQSVCAIIRQLIELGGHQQATEVKHKLATEYANKPAFKDELSKI